MARGKGGETVKAVVTGGNGFIGSHLVKKLIDEGREVVVVSDFRHGVENLRNLGVEVAWIKTDLRDYGQTLRAMAVGGGGAVFHLAAVVGGIGYLHGAKRMELEVMRANLAMDSNVFKSCVETGVKKLVYASSCAVYPMDRQNVPNTVFREGDLKLWEARPDGGYGWAKLVGETQLGLVRDMKIGIARIFNVYGVNEPLGEESHAVADLIRKAIAYPKEKFIVWGNGEQSRDYMYATDCADALFALEAKASNPPVVVNIGSGKPTNLRTIAEGIIRISGKGIEIEYDPNKPIGPRSRTASITKAKNLLGWQPKVNLDEGLGLTYAWIQNHSPDLHQE
jgi:nucleoside-diphosphate-sugar epimerase